MNVNTKKLDLKSLRSQAGLDIEKARRFSLVGVRSPHSSALRFRAFAYQQP